MNTEDPLDLITLAAKALRLERQNRRAEVDHLTRREDPRKVLLSRGWKRNDQGFDGEAWHYERTGLRVSTEIHEGLVYPYDFSTSGYVMPLSIEDLQAFLAIAEEYDDELP